MSELALENSIMQSSLHYLKGQRSPDWTTDVEPGLTVTEINQGCYLNLRGNANDAAFTAGVKDSLKLTLPTEAGTYSRHGLTMACWLGPDEWVIVSDQSAETVQSALGGALAGHISIVMSPVAKPKLTFEVLLWLWSLRKPVVMTLRVGQWLVKR